MRYQAALHPDSWYSNPIKEPFWRHFNFLRYHCMTLPAPPLPWLEPDDDFPPVSQAWGAESPAPGLLAAGGALRPQNLVRAYSRGIFPWFSEGQPVLWWSTSPRMTLHTREFRLHRSLKKTIRQFRSTPDAEVRINADFSAVLEACSQSNRPGQTGTWIVPEMQAAYLELHRSGYAHSVETWQGGELTGGLYCVAVGNAIFGESMFARRTDASKIALAALVAMLKSQGIAWIDCQQVTRHLAFMGARPVSREVFDEYLVRSIFQAPVSWDFRPLYWDQLLSACPNHP